MDRLHFYLGLEARGGGGVGVQLPPPGGMAGSGSVPKNVVPVPPRGMVSMLGSHWVYGLGSLPDATFSPDS